MTKKAIASQNIHTYKRLAIFFFVLMIVFGAMDLVARFNLGSGGGQSEANIVFIPLLLLGSNIAEPMVIISLIGLIVSGVLYAHYNKSQTL